LTQTTPSDKGDSMIRGYDSGKVLREDIIERVRHLREEITDLQKEVERLKQKAVAAEGRFQRLKREMGIID